MIRYPDNIVWPSSPYRIILHFSQIPNLTKCQRDLLLYDSPYLEVDIRDWRIIGPAPRFVHIDQHISPVSVTLPDPKQSPVGRIILLGGPNTAYVNDGNNWLPIQAPAP